ncbi:MAG TPA: RNA-binding S4 domain-containing protein [Stellaceae bacterium]|nr:RNA-binding S4 domain-containing protein [Stellaceae bacterium]
MSASVDTASPTIRRLDQWLWFARFAKSRSLAARLCNGGTVSVNGTKIRKPSHPVRLGDLLVVPVGKSRCRLRVVGLGERRGPASEARLLYEEIEPPTREPRAMPDWVPLLE